MGWTVDFRVDAQPSLRAYPFEVIVREAGTMQVELRIQHDQVTNPNQVRLVIQEEGGGARVTTDWVEDTGFHTWRVSRIDQDGPDLFVYVDDNPTPWSGTMAGTFTAGTQDLIFFGDVSGAVGGVSLLDYVNYDQDGPTYAPPIPEPHAIVLLAGAGLLLAGRSRKRRPA